ncbi:hypothetical protein H0H92_013847, partial [Tricholoma furcatifolium]
MPRKRYEAPPYRPPPISGDQDSNPPLLFDPITHPFAGLELTVSGLRRNTPRSATEHMYSIIEEISEAGQNFPPLDVSPGSSSKTECVDYVTLSLVDPFRAQP